jgi:DNA-binding MarR family transcriptional regulator
MKSLSRAAPQLESFELAHFLPYRLSVVTERVSRLIARVYADRFDLSVPEWRVIAHLGNSAGPSARSLAERTAMDKVKVSRAVAQLTSRRLLRRDVNPLDQRGVKLTLTPSGRRVYESIVPAALEMERAIVAELEPGDVEQLTSILDRIEARVARLDAAGRPADQTKR